MATYYVLEKFNSDTEGFTVKSPYDYFSESVTELNYLGERPFTFTSLEEAQDCKRGLELLFRAENRTKHYTFIIVEEIE